MDLILQSRVNFSFNGIGLEGGSAFLSFRGFGLSREVSRARGLEGAKGLSERMQLEVLMHAFQAARASGEVQVGAIVEAFKKPWEEVGMDLGDWTGKPMVL